MQKDRAKERNERDKNKSTTMLLSSRITSHASAQNFINPSGTCNRELKPLKPQGWLDALPEEMQLEKCNVPGTAAKNEEGQILKKQMQGS
jgi:hypothetical protein